MVGNRFLLAVIALILLASPVHAIYKTSSLVCGYNATTTTIDCVWEKFPDFPWAAKQSADENMITFDAGSSCGVNYICGGAGCTDYFGNAATVGTDYEYVALMNKVGGSFQRNITGVGGGPGQIFMIQCKDSPGAYRNQVEIYTSVSTTQVAGTVYVYSNGTNYYTYVAGSTGEFTEETGYVIGQMYGKITYAAFVPMLSSRNNKYYRNNLDTFFSGTKNATIPSSGSYQYWVESVSAGYSSVGVVSYYLSSPHSGCYYNVSNLGACTADCNCSYMYGHEQDCELGSCRIENGNPCVSSSQCKVDSVCDGGVCVIEDTGTCTGDTDCSSGACLNIGSSGVGVCGVKCSTDSDCTDAGIPLSRCRDVGHGDGDQKYCTRHSLTLCENNDYCYSGNCQSECGGSATRCTVTGYDCWCYPWDASCDSGETCQTRYGGPLSDEAGYVCVTGKSNGQTCATSSECGSGNCQNGYCCTANQTCCSVDTQCPSEKVCFNHDSWYGLPYYYTCQNKVDAGYYCAEDKECWSGECNDNICAGLTIGTTCQYNMSAGPVIAINQNVTIQALYIMSNGTTVPEPTLCKFYWTPNIYPAYEFNCSESVEINFTSPGTYRFSIVAYSDGYQTSFCGAQSIQVQQTWRNLKIGEVCNDSTQCISGRCEQVLGGVVTEEETVCYSDEGCSSYESAYCSGSQVTGNCSIDTDCPGGSDPYGQRCVNGQCKTIGRCMSYTGYGVCCANDGSPCCNYNSVGYDAYFQDCPKWTGRLCDPETFTCSISRLSNGVSCNRSIECWSGYCGPTYTDRNVTYCCVPIGDQSITQTFCCSSNNDDCHNSTFCDAIYPGTHRCTPWSGYSGEEGDECISHADCDIVNGYGCVSGVCAPFSCDTGVPCAHCKNKSIDFFDCDSENRTISCASSSQECTYWYSGYSTPEAQEEGAINIEDLFYGLLTLVYYVIVAVIFAFIILLFIGLLHLAYQLVKR